MEKNHGIEKLLTKMWRISSLIIGYFFLIYVKNIFIFGHNSSIIVVYYGVDKEEEKESQGKKANDNR